MTAANDFAERPRILSGRGGADQVLCGAAGSATGGRIRILNDTTSCARGLAVAERPLAVGF